MKKLVLFIFGAALSLPVAARDFTYEYEGQTLTYTVLSEEDKTAQIKAGYYDEESYNIERGNNVIGDLVIPAEAKDGNIAYTVTSIGEYAFYRCVDFASVKIPSSITFVGQGAFDSCFNITKAEFASVESLCNIEFEDRKCNPLCVNYNGINLWISGKEIKDLTIPGTVVKIGQYAFYNCKSMTSVTIPSCVTFIGKSAFNSCSGLTKAEFASIESLCNIEFESDESNPLGCAENLWIDGKEIKDLTIPDTVTKIGQYAFYRCSNLTSVTIPSSVTSIGEDAFENCYSLTSVYYDTEDPIEAEENVFKYCPEDATLYVPAAAVEKCKTISPWKYFNNILAYDFSGIDVSVADTKANANCEIYNINGIKVSGDTKNLPTGIYIVRQGDVCTKVVAK